nr:hypothetical protein [Streptomyces lunaelactis]
MKADLRSGLDERRKLYHEEVAVVIDQSQSDSGQVPTDPQQPAGRHRVGSSGRLGLVLSVVVGLVLVGRDVADCSVDALIVEPVAPFRGDEFDIGQAVPGATRLDQLGFVEADVGFHEGVVQGVPDRTDRGVDAGLEEMGGEREGRIY